MSRPPFDFGFKHKVKIHFQLAVIKVQQPDRRSYLKGIVAHCVDHILEEYLGGESVSMVDDGLAVGTIPAVHFHTPAASAQSPESQRQI